MKRKSKTAKSSDPMHSISTRKERIGDLMIETTTESHSAIIDFRKIVEACEVVPDNDMGPPWEEHDGWEHELVNLPDYHEDEAKQSKGYIYDRHGSKLVVITRETLEDWQGQYCWDRGEHRSTYEDRLTKTRRQGIKKLTDWHKNGDYGWWGVTCEFMDYDSSGLWGIQVEDGPDDPYIDEIKYEQAEEIACAMEEDGYTIIHRPVPYKADYWQRLASYHARVARQLGFDNVEEYDRWLHTPYGVGNDVNVRRRVSRKAKARSSQVPKVQVG